MTRKKSLKILLQIKTLVEGQKKNCKRACEFQSKHHFKEKQKHFEWLTELFTKSRRDYQI